MVVHLPVNTVIIRKEDDAGATVWETAPPKFCPQGRLDLKNNQRKIYLFRRNLKLLS